MKNIKQIITVFSIVFLATSCSKDDNPAVNEEELITTVTTTLVGGGQTITMISKDLDGIDGPNAPVVTVSESLVAGRTYEGTTTFTNELVSPAEDITVEVEEEGADHQLFYQLASNLGTVTYNDFDNNGKPIGLSFTLIAGTSATSGNLTVTLKHLPNKSASGVATGDITNAAGNTDTAVVFPITVN